MARITKQQKRIARKKKKAEYRKRRKQRLKNESMIPWVPVKMHLFKMPELLPTETPKEKRIEILRSIGRKAKVDYETKYQSIQEWIKNYDPLYLLSYCAVYFVSSPEGIDPEVEGSLDFYPFLLEIMQAFALRQHRTISTKQLLQDAERLLKDIKEIGELMALRFLDIPEGIETDEDASAYALRRDMIGQTTAIRNWAYPYQMKKVVRDLAELTRGRFEAIHGVDPVKLMDVLFALTEERNILLNEHRKKIQSFIGMTTYREMIEAYNQAFPSDGNLEGEEVDQIWVRIGENLEILRNTLILYADFKLEDIFSFDFDHVLALYGDPNKSGSLRKILDRLSYSFGEIKDFDPDFFVLDNPVLHRPFIKVSDNKFYSVIFVSLFHHMLGILEDLIADNNDFREEYSQSIKPKYLENELERLLRTNFPNATIYRGSQWVDPLDGKTYENDLLVLVDTFALVVEAKSGVLTPPAKRGAPKRLFETLQELIEEPSIQAHRLISYLKSNNCTIAFSSKSGAKHIIDSSKIKYYIPLGITLTELGTISTNLKALIKAGVTERKITELAPSISLTALELIFELLPIEPMKLHYLARRREFEVHVNYIGDEMDLLAFYLDNGFNIGEDEYKGEMSLMLTIKSKELDPYFIGIHEGVSVDKPRLAMSTWWHDLLMKLADTRPSSWVETSYVLLNSTKEDQEKFEYNYKTIKYLVKEGTVAKKHNWVEFISGPEQRRYLIVGYPYSMRDREANHNVINSIIDSKQAKSARGVVVIGQYVHQLSYPYSILACKKETNLIDLS